MKSITLQQYRNRILKVVDHIWKNVERSIDVNELADVAHFSPYHFHRIYREMMHETVAASVKRLRLHFAAHQLIYSGDQIKDIGARIGYSGAEAFIRAFTQHYGDSPASYRQKKQAVYQLDKLQAHSPDISFDLTKDYPDMYQVDVKHIEPIQMAGIPHKGDYLHIGQAFEKLFASAVSNGMLRPETRSIGVYYDDPSSKDINELKSHACISISSDEGLANGLDKVSVEGGEFAVLVFKGPYAELEPVYQWFYGEWLPKSGRVPADKPPFEEYLNNPREVPASELLTAIHIPLAS